MIKIIWVEEPGRIVTLTQDGLIQVWDDETGQEWLRYAPPKGVSQVVWAPDGNRILVGEENGLIHPFYTRISDLLKIACSYSIRNMSVTEWFRHIGSNEDYEFTQAFDVLNEGLQTQHTLKSPWELNHLPKRWMCVQQV